MSTADRILGILFAAAAMAVIVWVSNAPMTAHASSDAMLRLAWSARPERIEECRERSPEELARLPQHMRQPLACVGTTAEYRLQVRVGGALVVERVVHGGGLRRDRRLYVFEELPVRAGGATVEISFDRLGGGTTGATTDSDRQKTSQQGTPSFPRQNAAAVPPHLSLQRRLQFTSRQVILVTFDPDRRELVLLQGGSVPTTRFDM